MLRNIASKLFDTINKMSIQDDDMVADDMSDDDDMPCDDDMPDDDDMPCDNKEASYIVSIPNKTTPFKFTRVKPIVLCIYQVRTDGLYPFLLFLFQLELEQACFISLPTFDGGIGHKKIKNVAVTFMKSIFPNTDFAYAGFYEGEDKNVIILQCVERESGPTSFGHVWATPFEIINKNSILHRPFHSSVLSFFYRNPAFLILKTLDHRNYESPMIGYADAPSYPCPFEELDIYRETILPGLGKSYYLFSEQPPPDKKTIRVAFFAGIMLLYPEKKKRTYDSLLCPNKRYVIQNYNQHVILPT